MLDGVALVIGIKPIVQLLYNGSSGASGVVVYMLGASCYTTIQQTSTPHKVVMQRCGDVGTFRQQLCQGVQC